MQKFNPLLHHRKSIRLKGYDYSSEGLYFVTICCHEMNCLFGKISEGEMILNELGQIAYREWINTLEIRTNVELLEFVIMPNHIHGIIKIISNFDLSLLKDKNSKQFRSNLETVDIKGEFNSPLQLQSNSPQPPLTSLSFAICIVVIPFRGRTASK